MKLLNRIKNLFSWNSNPKPSRPPRRNTYRYTIDSQLNSELDDLKQESLTEAQKKGKVYGQQDIPAPDQMKPSPFEDKLKASFNKHIQKIHERISEPLARIDRSLQSLRDKLVYAEADEVERKTEVIDSARNDSEDARSEAEKNHMEESSRLKSRLAEIQNQLRILNQQLDLIPIEKRQVMPLFIFIGLAFLSVGGEGWMNFRVFEFLLGEGWWATLLVTIAFSACVVFGCHFIGKHLPLLFSKGELGKKLGLWSSIVLFAIVFYVLGQFRHDYILTLNPSATTMEPWQFMLLNLLLCGIMAYASYRYTRYDSEKMSERKKLEHTVAEKEKEHQQLKGKLDRLNGQHAASLSNIKSSYNREVGSVHAKSDTLRNQIADLEIEGDELRAFARSTELEVQDAYREVISEFRDVNFRYRPSKVIPAYWDQPLELDLHFQDAETGNSRRGGMVKLMTKASVILLFLGLFSCNQAEPERTKALVAVDVTDSFTVEKLPTGPGFLEAIGFSLEAANAQSLECGFTVLSDVSANKVEYLSIDLTDTDENKFNRIARGKKFSEELEHLISGYGQLTKGKQRSCLYRPICHLLNELQESNADHKVLIVFSDLLENSDIINLYQPEYLTRATFNDSWVKSRFDQKVPFPRCDGVDVIVACQPNVQNDRLILKIQALYRSFFEEHGAKSISFVTDI